MPSSHILYIDDSGGRLPSKTDAALIRDDGMDHFALGGILVARKDKEAMRELFDAFRTKWLIDYPLHSSDIRGKRGNFAWLNNDEDRAEAFLGGLDELLRSLPVLGFAAVIHRPGYNARYEPLYGEKRWWMCKTALTILLERVCKHLQAIEGTLEIKFEMSGKSEDRAIIQYVKDLKKVGMPFSEEASAHYEALSPEDFTAIILGEPRGKTKYGIGSQLADLFLYPMAKRRYVPDYRAWTSLYDSKKVIDAIISEERWPTHGIKYSCFDDTDC